jgi:hypothetical protein
MSFTLLPTPVVDPESGDEFTHQCEDCGSSLGLEYFGSWIEDSGEFGDDRWVIECFGCGHIVES